MKRSAAYILFILLISSCSINTNKVNSVTNPTSIKKVKYSHYAIDNINGNKHALKRNLLAWKDNREKEKNRKKKFAEHVDVWGCPTYY